jgi:hypothetical protein
VQAKKGRPWRSFWREDLGGDRGEHAGSTETNATGKKNLTRNSGGGRDKVEHPAPWGAAETRVEVPETGATGDADLASGRPGGAGKPAGEEVMANDAEQRRARGVAAGKKGERLGLQG